MDGITWYSQLPADQIIPISPYEFHVGAAGAHQPMDFIDHVHMPNTRGAGQVAQAGDYWTTLEERINPNQIWSGCNATQSQLSTMSDLGGSVAIGGLLLALLLYR